MRGLRVSLVILVLAFLVGGLLTLDRTPPTFDPVLISSIVSTIQLEHRLSPLSLNDTIRLLHFQLHAAYPSHIHPLEHTQWLFNLAGGFKTGLLLFHASLTDYIAVWGSAVHTVGHSGRNWAEFHDWILAGNGTWWEEGGVAVTHHTPPAYLHTERWAGRVVELKEGTWMLEYCHGVIPALLPFGLGDGLLSSMDPLLVWRSLRIYGWMTAHALLQGKL